uniref:Uncharacterized protein n=1 Tax=Ananas comosus var. bracteatus TaxID=296719 RepID=A0A6V7QMX7_ANACO|nr:unnamed protein product [Ananas comosus var. bracteatus]
MLRYVDNQDVYRRRRRHESVVYRRIRRVRRGDIADRSISKISYYLLGRWWRWLDERAQVYQYFEIPKYIKEGGGCGRQEEEENPLYRKAAAYVASLPSLEDADAAAISSSARKPNDFALHLAPRHSAHDAYLGARLSWTDAGAGALVLRVRRQDRTRVLRPYLQHVESVADEIELRRAGSASSPTPPAAGGLERRRGVRAPGDARRGGDGRGAEGARPRGPGGVPEGPRVLPPAGARVAAQLPPVRRARHGQVLVRRRHGPVPRVRRLRPRPRARPRPPRAPPPHDAPLPDPRGGPRPPPRRARARARARAAADGDPGLHGRDLLVLRRREGDGVHDERGRGKETLDPAVLRPGRLDVHIHFPLCDFAAFKTLASSYLG